MTTTKELDDRLRKVASRSPRNKYTDRGWFRYNELLLFTTELHTLLLCEGFDSIYEPTDNYYSQTILVRLGQGHVTVMISSMAHIFMDTRYPRPDTVEGVVNLLHDIPRLQQVEAYCSTCYYSNHGGEYCGMGYGQPLVTEGCGGYIGRTQL
jgi:hypothetical protein